MAEITMAEALNEAKKMMVFFKSFSKVAEVLEVAAKKEQVLGEMATKEKNLEKSVLSLEEQKKKAESDLGEVKKKLAEQSATLEKETSSIMARVAAANEKARVMIAAAEADSKKEIELKRMKHEEESFGLDAEIRTLMSLKKNLESEVAALKLQLSDIINRYRM